jgi:hypothetical protein
MTPYVVFSSCNAELTLCVTQLLDLLASTNASSLDTIMDSVFNAMFLQVTLFLGLCLQCMCLQESGVTILDSLQCHVPVGDNIRDPACFFR